jgi:hypothetical protein
VSSYNQGLAGTSFNSLVSALQGFVNTGASSANALGGMAINSGNAQANTLGQIGTSQASGTLGSANALAGGITGAANATTLPLLMSYLQNNAGGAPGGIYTTGQNFGVPAASPYANYPEV